MKCVTCGGSLKEENVEQKEFGVSLGKFLGKVCTKCGDVFYDEEIVDKIQAKSKELGLFGLAKKTKVAQVGNSLAIRIPKDIAQFIGLKKEEEVTITPSGKKSLSMEIH